MTGDLPIPKGWPVTDVPIGWTVTIRCAADAHDAAARPVVAVATCTSDGVGRPPWSFELRGRSAWAALDRARGDGTASVLHPESWMSGRVPERMALRLRCPSCSESLPIGDEFTLYDRMNARALRRKHSDTLQGIRSPST